MGDGIRPCAGEFLVSPAGLELSMSWCGHDCAYCFSNAMKPNRRADLAQITGLIANFRSRRSREALLLQAGVPLLVSNHVDPFAGTNARQFEPIWELLVAQGIPIAWQTRGAHKPQRAFLDRVIRETPPSVWYISIPMTDEGIRQRIEPRAPALDSRFALIDDLIAAGHTVTVGINPISTAWLPDFRPLIDRLAAAGVWGVWVEPIYFSKAFKGNLRPDQIAALDAAFIAAAGDRGRPEDRQHAAAARAYALDVGMQSFSTSSSEPSQFFDPWHTIYPRVMPYWQQVINAADASLEPGDEESVAVITMADALSVLEPLPELDWAEPLRHRRARHYRVLTEPFPGGPLPRQDVAGFWRIVWNDELFAKGLGILSYPRCAFAAVINDDEITPLLDDQGHRIVVYRREPWPHLYADMPELA